MNPPNLAIVDSAVAAHLALVAYTEEAAVAHDGKYQAIPLETIDLACPGVLRGKASEYVGAAGVGYNVTFTYSLDADTWFRSVNVGPETQREKGWWQKRAGTGRP